MNDLSKEIGNRICKKRKDKKMKQKDFVEFLDGATNQMVSGWENGNSIPSASYLIKISKILDTSIDYLLTGKENNPNDKIAITYKDAIDYMVALRYSGLFETSFNNYMGERLFLETRDKTILSFCHELESLEGAYNVIGQEVFEQQLKKLILRYDSIIEKKKDQ